MNDPYGIRNVGNQANVEFSIALVTLLDQTKGKLNRLHMDTLYEIDEIAYATRGVNRYRYLTIPERLIEF